MLPPSHKKAPCVYHHTTHM